MTVNPVSKLDAYPIPDLFAMLTKGKLFSKLDLSQAYQQLPLDDISKEFGVINTHKGLFRFTRRNAPLKDYPMTRVTFGVSASSFAANMSVKQNAQNFEHKFPLAAKVVEESVYVDDCLTSADDIEGAIFLYRQLLSLFDKGNFLLSKWNSSDSYVLDAIDPSLRDAHEVLSISEGNEYTKTLGLEWNTTMDHFRLAVTNLSSPEGITKRMLVSNVAKVFDVLGWFSPTIIKVKILLQSSAER